MMWPVGLGARISKGDPHVTTEGGMKRLELRLLKKRVP